ncbi:acyl-CoA dehydrogenase, partial [Mycobacterium sp. ITM-2017-0098]
APLNVGATGTTATRTDSGFRIDGVKDRVEAGAESGAALVVATRNWRSSPSQVATDAPGVTVTAQKSVDMVKRYARVQFDGVEVAESAAVGTAA